MARIKPQTLLQQSKKKKGPTRISLTTIIFCNLLIVLIVLSLVTTYRYWSQRSRNIAELGLSDLDQDADADTGKPSYAILDTSKGSITVELFREASPEVIEKFIHLCSKGYFKGMPFQRVIKNYVIQAGKSRGLGEDWTSKIKLQEDQLITSPKHESFMLGTPKATHDTKGFDLFITTSPIPDLNDKIVVFGQVTKGEDVVKEIEEVDTYNYQPKTPIRIINITSK